MMEIEVGKFYKNAVWGWVGNFDDFCYDFPVCGVCTFKNDFVARFTFGRISNDGYHAVPEYTLALASAGKYPADTWEEISEKEYAEYIKKYNERIECTKNAKYPMPAATI